jgi:phosphohistidine swiveling domain-containing protein
MKTIQTFKELSGNDREVAGGKGGTLARLLQAGYSVPDGFVIMPAAFEGDDLKPDAWLQVVENLEKLRSKEKEISFAVRSSALAEDSAFASFAGEFETVLDVHTNEAVQHAIHQVHQSKKSERVKAYSEAKGLEEEQEIAVVVQELVRADISGILFTADPVTGNRFTMMGNFVYGFGEELVSGESEPYTFVLHAPKGTYEGPDDLKKYAKELYKLASNLEKELGCPQDIEWSIMQGRLYLLQSRPITTLREHDPVSYNWNSSHTGDFLWAQLDVYPEVFTPSSWSLWRNIFHRKIAGTSIGGNIAGRLYMNYSLTYSLMLKLGRSHQDAIDYLMVSLGVPPKGAEIPIMPLSLGQIFAHTSLSEFIAEGIRRKTASKHLAIAPEKYVELQSQVQQAQSEAELIELWNDRVYPFFWDSFLTQSATNEEYINPYIELKKRLVELLGEVKALEFIASIGGGSEDFTSIGITSGLGKVARGEMSREDYLKQYGHRHSNENEIATPRPYEDPDWLDSQLSKFQHDPSALKARIEKRADDFDTVLDKLEHVHPRHAKKIHKLIDQIRDATHLREACRSELTRAVGLVREWFLRAASFTKLDDDIFFLTYHEVLALLDGDDSATDFIPARRNVYKEYKALPPYPGWIRGRFDPVQWSEDPNRRMDIFDAHKTIEVESDSDTITGHAGSVGQVEGIVRIVDSPDEGHLLQQGEILVAVTTNIGWTPIFPKARAVVTDIGAPLAHAAIVARELGIPAVVGCGNATRRLNTGDRIRVDGGRGIVEILETASR